MTFSVFLADFEDGRSRVRILNADQILHNVTSGSPPLQHLRR